MGGSTSNGRSSEIDFLNHLRSEWFGWVELLNSMRLQIIPLNQGGFGFRKGPKEKGNGKKGFREVKNLTCSINYDGRLASREASVSNGS